jgi:hypothetical protein
MEQFKSFSQYILQIGYKYGVNSVFDDFFGNGHLFFISWCERRSLP